MSGSMLSLPTKDAVSPTLSRREKSVNLERKLSDLPPIEGLSSSPGNIVNFTFNFTILNNFFRFRSLSSNGS